MEESQLLIRRMLEADIPQVHEIDTLSLSLPWSERSYRFEVCENRAARPWVAEVTLPDGSRKLAAMLGLWRSLDEAPIATVAVHPDCRRKGIGLRLTAHALADAAHTGARCAAALLPRQSRRRAANGAGKPERRGAAGAGRLKN